MNHKQYIDNRNQALVLADITARYKTIAKKLSEDLVKFITELDLISYKYKITNNDKNILENINPIRQLARNSWLEVSRVANNEYNAWLKCNNSDLSELAKIVRDDAIAISDDILSW